MNMGDDYKKQGLNQSRRVLDRYTINFIVPLKTEGE